MSGVAEEVHPLVGSWKLISLQTTIEGEAPANAFGERPNGYLIFTREGRAVAFFTARGRRAGFDDADRADLHKSMAAATGKYRIIGDSFIISVDASWNESWNGAELKRYFVLEGDKLFVETAPAPSIVRPNKNAVSKLVFEREK
jgi:hypothetical protein